MRVACEQGISRPKPALTSPTNIRGKPHDRPFNGFRIAKTAKTKALVEDVVRQVQDFETFSGLRKRFRKENDQLQFEQQIEAVVCDLIHMEITAPSGRVYISFRTGGKKDRYRAKVESKTLPTIIRTMGEAGFVEYKIGTNRGHRPNEGERTTIWVGPRLSTHQFTLDDFGVAKGEEIIILKSSKQGYWDEGRELQYTDSPLTMAYRDELQRINACLENSDITYQGPLTVDVGDRRLHRTFNNGSFEEGGRLFGGFWQPMSKTDRSEIRIYGSRIVELDYGHMVPRLLYGMAGVQLDNDAYAIPGLESHRDGVKQVLNAMLHSDKPLTRFPKETKPFFPKGMRVTQVTKLIEDYHKPVGSYFYSGRGLHLFYLESQIMIQVLTRLFTLGVTALPIHDAILIAKDHQEVAKKVMLTVFQELSSIDGVVSVHQL